MELYVESMFLRVAMLNSYANECYLATNFSSSSNKTFTADEKNF